MSSIKKTGVIKEWYFNDNNDIIEKPAKPETVTKEEVMKEWDFSVDENEVLLKQWDFSDDENNVLIKEWDFSDDKKESFDLSDKEYEEFALEDDLNVDAAPDSATLKLENSDAFLNTLVDCASKIEFIDQDKLIDIDSSINFFPRPSDEEFFDLMENIEIYGVLSPLLVIKRKDSDMYTVVSGRSRLDALKRLFNESLDVKYYSVPCITLNPNTDESIIQGIVVSTNLNYRKMPKDVQIKAVLALDRELLRNKKYRNQLNITNIIANKVGISRSTTNRLRSFKNLSDNALDLLYKDYLSRESAAILSTIKDKETQDVLIDRLGRQINNVSVLKEMMANPRKKDKEQEFDLKVTTTDTVRNQIELDRKIKKVEQMFPEYTTITLKVNNIELEAILRDITYIRAGVAKKHQTIKKGEINKYLNVSLNDVHMDQYLKNGIVTQETIDLIKSDDYGRITTLA